VRDFNMPDTFIERSATRKGETTAPESRRLQDWDHLDAYVLLAEPGAGKSLAFRHQAAKSAGGAIYISARTLLALGPPPGWTPNTILFIDALDERRGAASSTLTSLDELRTRLHDLGRPRFRLSCREADWLAGGIKDLEEVAPGGKVAALWLDPLSLADVHRLLAGWSPHRVADPDQFVENATRSGLSALLTNPLLLELLADAVKKDGWPGNRSEIYESACRQMVTEHNDLRVSTMPSTAPSEDELLAAAARLCALLLLSDATTLSTKPVGPTGSRVVSVRHLPQAFMRNPIATMECLKTKLFTSEHGEYSPRHRTIAEYLAAKAVAVEISDDLPIRRVLTFMSGGVGRVVDSLRALYAWLCLQSASSRWLLVSMDPMALVLYGDVRPFSRSDKEKVLEALYWQGRDFRWFRSENWDAQPFGALGTCDMAPVFRHWMRSSSREPAHQAVVECIADAIQYGDKALMLADELEAIVRDASYDEHVREHALDAWLSRLDVHAAKRLLEDVHHQQVSDPQDQLLGAILDVLYPVALSPKEALKYLRAEKKRFFIGNYRMFWMYGFQEKLPEDQILDITDRVTGEMQDCADDDDTDRGSHLVARLALRLVLAALLKYGESIDGRRLYAWLRVGVNEHGSFDSTESEADGIREWLNAHSLKRREAFEAGIGSIRPNKEGQRYFYAAEERLFRSVRPLEWARWLLDIASRSSDEEVAKYCFQEAAGVVVSSHYRHDLSIEDIDDWVCKHVSRWPSAEQWKTEKFWWKLDAYQRRQFESSTRRLEREQVKRGQRQRDFASHLASLATVDADKRVLDLVASAYLGRIACDGETPRERVQDLLVVDEATADGAIRGLRFVLQRSDLPGPSEILEARKRDQRLFLGRPCLLAAKLISIENPQAWKDWSEALRRTLVAFYCAENDEVPLWYAALAAESPAVVAEVVLQFTAPSMADANGPHLRALYSLRDDSAPRSLARLLLPPLWALTPAAPVGNPLHFFETVTLNASLTHLEESENKQLIEQKIQAPGTSEQLAVALHLGAARFDPSYHAAELVAICRRSPAMVAAVAHSLSHRTRRDIDALASVPGAIGQLIESMAAGAEADRPDEVSDYSGVDRLRDAAQALLRGLVSTTSPSASAELRRLRDAPSLQHWAVYLDSLIFEHARIVNGASYAPPSVSDVVSTLTNGAPTSPRDMAELARDHLAHLANKIRFEESNLRRAFYRSPLKPPAPKSASSKATVRPGSTTARDIPRIENDCRDVLLGLINERLRELGVKFAKEASYAGDTRADLQVEAMRGSRRLIVPVEVKKDDHPKVWTAWRDQLEARYTANPDAQGIGMYLVLWFGYGTTVGPDGRKARSAQEMAHMLDELIPGQKRNHIVGLVMDFTEHRG
jgi:hypothetical protein